MAAEAAIQKRIDSWELDLSDLDPARRIYLEGQIRQTLVDLDVYSDDNKRIAAANSIGLGHNFIEHLQKEKQYSKAKQYWDQYHNWKENRNKVRAELEAASGYDSKHGSHLVRLLNMAEEILTTGEINVKRPDAELLLSIRNGAWSYEELIEFAEKKEKSLDDLYQKSTLTDRDWETAQHQDA